jgi:serine/threonine protein kinase
MPGIGDYILQETLGEGTFGKVIKATKHTTNEQVAIKIINKASIKKPKTKLNLEREIFIMRLLKHKNIIKLNDVLQTDKYLFYIMEYNDNTRDLYDYLEEKKILSEEESFKIFKQLLDGIEYCHKHLICHRDLKLENIIIDDKTNIKIIDFNLSNTMYNTHYFNTMCGSPHYISPEVIENKPYDGTCRDVWSCGIILYILLSGKYPFNDDDMYVLFRKIRLTEFVIPDTFGPNLTNIIRKMLIKDPSKRISICDIRKHSWYIKMMNKFSDSFVKKAMKSDVGNYFIIDNPDNYILSLMQELGWENRKKLVLLLKKNEKNIESVIYRLLESDDKKYINKLELLDVDAISPKFNKKKFSLFNFLFKRS